MVYLLIKRGFASMPKLLLMDAETFTNDNAGFNLLRKLIKNFEIKPGSLIFGIVKQKDSLRLQVLINDLLNLTGHTAFTVEYKDSLSQSIELFQKKTPLFPVEETANIMLISNDQALAQEAVTLKWGGINSKIRTSGELSGLLGLRDWMNRKNSVGNSSFFK